MSLVRLTGQAKDFRFLVVHAELSRADLAAEATPSSARTTQAARYKSAIESRVLGGLKMAVARLHLLPALSCQITLSLWDAYSSPMTTDYRKYLNPYI